MNTDTPRRPCAVCELDPRTFTIETTNRGLYGVNHKLWIEPMCAEHDDLDPAKKVESLLDYAGMDFLADGVCLGVLDREEAMAELDDDERAELAELIEEKQ